LVLNTLIDMTCLFGRSFFLSKKKTDYSAFPFVGVTTKTSHGASRMT
jgi:hypothetical protein